MTPFLLACSSGGGRGEDRKEDAVKVQSDPHELGHFLCLLHSSHGTI